MLDHPRAQRLRLYVQVAGEHLVVVLEELAGSREAWRSAIMRLETY
jgi:hypothetical protein